MLKLLLLLPSLPFQTGLFYTTQSGEYHYKMRLAFTPLKSHDVLIIASGNATHNLQSLNIDAQVPPP
ncbi:hypothetical protein SUGI_0765940 [Cryptomeria japonica]|nr:hypothetical protein SUGI_0765940 [Cryptomeria japonica]